MNAKRAAAYGDGPVRRLAATMGRRVEVYRDFKLLVRDLEAGNLDAVALPAFSAIPKTLLPRFIDAAESAALATVGGEVDLATLDGRSFAARYAALLRADADGRSARASARHAADAAAGKPWKAGARCFGYDRDGAIVPVEADALREAARRIVEGESVRAVATWLNASGPTTTAGGGWHPTSLRRLLTSPRISGRRNYHGRMLAGDWEPIITPGTQDRLVKSLAERSTGRRVSTPRRYLLTGGLLVCGLCGNALSSQPSRGRKRGYVCRQGAGLSGCGRIRIQADPVETETVDRVIARLASPKVRSRLAALMGTPEDFDPSRFEEAIESERARLAEAGREYADGWIDAVSFRAASGRLQERIADLRGQSACARRLHDLPGLSAADLLDWFDRAPLPAQRDLVAAVLDHVVVGPATRRGPVGLDEDRLEWIWR